MSYIGELQANTAVDILIGPFVDDTDGKTAETALTIDVELSKNGQALANKNDATAPVHEGTGTIDGYYNCELDATDTNTEGQLTIVCFATGALPVRHDASILSQAAWLSKYTAKDTGYLDVNVKAISEDTVAADNLEAFTDGTGYVGGTAKLTVDVSKINGVATTSVTTVSAYQGTTAANTAQTGDSYAIVNGASGCVATKVDTAAIKVMTDKVGTVTNTGGTATIGAILGDFANNALVTRVANIQSDTDTIDTAGEIAAAVWSADATSYQTQGTFGQAIGDPVSDTNTLYKAVVTDATGATVGVDVVAVKAQLDVIQADTDLLDDAVGGLADIHTDVAAVKAETALIVADTGELQTNQGNWLTATGFATTAEIADVPTVTEFNARTLPSADYTIVSDLGVVQTGDTYAQLPANFTHLAITDTTGLVSISRPTGAVATDAGNSSTVFKTTLSSAVDNFWNGIYLKITSGDLLGQVRKISDYDGTNKIVTVSEAFTGIPADAVTFTLVNE